MSLGHATNSLKKKKNAAQKRGTLGPTPDLPVDFTGV